MPRTLRDARAGAGPDVRVADPHRRGHHGRGRRRRAPRCRGADRVWVNTPVMATLSSLGREIVLRHEILHVATGAAATAATPLWLEEGLAEFVGYRGSGVPLRTADRRRAAGRARRARARPRCPTRASSPDRALAEAYESAARRVRPGRRALGRRRRARAALPAHGAAARERPRRTSTGDARGARLGTAAFEDALARAAALAGRMTTAGAARGRGGRGRGVACWSCWRCAGCPPSPCPAVADADIAADFTARRAARERDFRRRVRPWGLVSVALGVLVPDRARRSAAPSPPRWTRSRVPWWVEVVGGRHRSCCVVDPGWHAAGRRRRTPRSRSRSGSPPGRWALWWRDVAVATLLAWVLTVGRAGRLGRARRAPGRTAWWVVVAAVAAVLVVLLSFVLPVRRRAALRPVSRRWPSPTCARRLLALAERDGVAVRDVLVADASRRTSALNAYVSGLGAHPAHRRARHAGRPRTRRRGRAPSSRTSSGTSSPTTCAPAPCSARSAPWSASRRRPCCCPGRRLLDARAARRGRPIPRSPGCCSRSAPGPALLGAPAAERRVAAASSGGPTSTASTSPRDAVDRRARCTARSRSPTSRRCARRALLHLWFGTHPTSPERIAAARAWARATARRCPGRSRPSRAVAQPDASGPGAPGAGAAAPRHPRVPTSTQPRCATSTPASALVPRSSAAVGASSSNSCSHPGRAASRSLIARRCSRRRSGRPGRRCRRARAAGGRRTTAAGPDDVVGVEHALLGWRVGADCREPLRAPRGRPRGSAAAASAMPSADPDRRQRQCACARSATGAPSGAGSGSPRARASDSGDHGGEHQHGGRDVAPGDAARSRATARTSTSSPREGRARPRAHAHDDHDQRREQRERDQVHAASPAATRRWRCVLAENRSGASSVVRRRRARRTRRAGRGERRAAGRRQRRAVAHAVVEDARGPPQRAPAAIGSRTQPPWTLAHTTTSGSTSHQRGRRPSRQSRSAHQPTSGASMSVSCWLRSWAMIASASAAERKGHDAGAHGAAAQRDAGEHGEGEHSAHRAVDERARPDRRACSIRAKSSLGEPLRLDPGVRNGRERPAATGLGDRRARRGAPGRRRRCQYRSMSRSGPDAARAAAPAAPRCRRAGARVRGAPDGSGRRQVTPCSPAGRGHGPAGASPGRESVCSCGGHVAPPVLTVAAERRGSVLRASADEARGATASAVAPLGRIGSSAGRRGRARDAGAGLAEAALSWPPRTKTRDDDDRGDAGDRAGRTRRRTRPRHGGRGADAGDHGSAPPVGRSPELSGPGTSMAAESDDVIGRQVPSGSTVRPIRPVIGHAGRVRVRTPRA